MKKIIKIEKRFEKNLRERFDEGNAVGEGVCYKIKVPCELCQIYYNYPSCGKCPFSCFKSPLADGWANGCVVFIENIMKIKTETLSIVMNFNEVMWPAFEDKEARAFLRLLYKEAKKIIKFV